MLLKDGSNVTDDNSSSNKSTHATETTESIESIGSIESTETIEATESIEKANYISPKHPKKSDVKAQITNKIKKKLFLSDNPKTGIFVVLFSKKMAINEVMLKDSSNAINANSSNETTEKTNYSKSNVSPKKSNVEAQITNKPTQKSFWKDHPKIGIFVGLCAIFSLVGLCVATYFLTQNTPRNWNCNETACKVGTGVVTGVKGVIAGISYVMCKYQYGLSCGVYPGV